VLSRLAVGVRVDGDDDELELELELELESGNSQLLEVYELHSQLLERSEHARVNMSCCDEL
jgi:hypothetical protein